MGFNKEVIKEIISIEDPKKSKEDPVKNKENLIKSIEAPISEDKLYYVI